MLPEIETPLLADFSPNPKPELFRDPDRISV